MKKLEKILLLIISILCIPLTLGVAPTSVELTQVSNGTTFLGETLEYPIFINVIDPDSTFLNCSVEADFIDADDVFQDDYPIDEFQNIVNNTETFREIEFAFFQESNDIITYNYTVSCTDGVDTTNSSMYVVTMRGFFLYTEGDIARATINGLVKGFIFLGLMMVVIGIILIFIWGRKKLKFEIG